MVVALRIFLLLAWAAFSTTRATLSEFPKFKDIVSDGFLDGLSEEHITSIQKMSRAKELSSTSLNLYIFCIDTNKGQLDVLPAKDRLEESLGSKLQIYVVDNGLSVVCWQSVVTSGQLTSAQSVIDDLGVKYSSVPGQLKIYRNVMDLVESGLTRTKSTKKNNRFGALAEGKISHSTELIGKEVKGLELVVSFLSPASEWFRASPADVQNQKDVVARALSTALHTTNNEFRSYGRWSSVHAKLTGSSAICNSMPSISDNDFISRSAEVRIPIDLFKSKPISCFISFVEALAVEGLVAKISIATPPKPLNYEARGITQSATAYNEPYSDAGLTGKGQIIGVADTGLDDFTCFFVDDSNTPTPREMISGPQSCIFDTYPGDISCLGKIANSHSSRRKVVQYLYNYNTDKIDTEGGHGTHVAGSIAGSCIQKDFFFSNGMAPDAQIAFTDIGWEDDTLTFANLELYDIFGANYKAGARIHSNSWGAPYGPYDFMSYQTDLMMYYYPDLLIIYAAANDGYEGSASVGSPAIAKNSLSVGATTKRLDPGDTVPNVTTLAYFSSMGPTTDGRYGVDITAPGDYIVSAYAEPLSTQKSHISSNGGTYQRYTTQTMSGTSMATPVTAGTAALIRQYLTDSDFWTSVCLSADAFCKVFNPTAALLKALILNSGTPVNRYSDPSNNCGPNEQRGVYCPYFDSFALPQPPDIYQGFGEITLSNILPLQNGTGLNPNQALFIYDNLTLATNQIMVFTLNIAADKLDDTAGLPVKCTIAWTDFPKDPSSTASQDLINDIDLLVVTPTGKAYWGNKVSGGDTKNPAEQVYINVDVDGLYKIYIRAKTLLTSVNQAVAFALTYPHVVDDSTYVTGPVLLTGSMPTTAESTVTYTQPAAPTPTLRDFSLYTTHTIDVVVSNLSPSVINQMQPVASLQDKGRLNFISFEQISLTIIDNGAPTNIVAAPWFTVEVVAPNGMRAQVGGEATTGSYAIATDSIMLGWPNQEFDQQSFSRDLYSGHLTSMFNVTTRDWMQGSWAILLGLGVNLNSNPGISSISVTGKITLTLDRSTEDAPSSYSTPPSPPSPATSSPSSFPTSSAPPFPLQSSIYQSSLPGQIPELVYALMKSGGTGDCVSFSAYGMLGSVYVYFYFDGKGSFNSWASDMFLTVSTSGGCYQIGGYNYIKTGCSIAGAWPERFKTNTKGYYDGSLDLSSFSLISGSWEVCIGNGWVNSGEVSYFGTSSMFNLSMTSQPPTPSPPPSGSSCPIYSVELPTGGCECLRGYRHISNECIPCPVGYSTVQGGDHCILAKTVFNLDEKKCRGYKSINFVLPAESVSIKYMPNTEEKMLVFLDVPPAFFNAVSTVEARFMISHHKVSVGGNSFANVLSKGKDYYDKRYLLAVPSYSGQPSFDLSFPSCVEHSLKPGQYISKLRLIFYGVPPEAMLTFDTIVGCKDYHLDPSFPFDMNEGLCTDIMQNVSFPPML